MRVVVLTKIFPSSLEPLSAPFNLQQIAELSRRCDVEVLEAIPHLPFARTLSVPARAARLAALPRARARARDRRDLRAPALRAAHRPGGGGAALPRLALPAQGRLRTADVLLATWAYPDGCAAVLAARAVGKPCVVKVHGSDVNVVLRTRAARAVASRILPRADAVIAVSNRSPRSSSASGSPASGCTSF